MALYTNPYGEPVELDAATAQMLGWAPVSSPTSSMQYLDTYKTVFGETPDPSRVKQDAQGNWLYTTQAGTTFSFNPDQPAPYTPQWYDATHGAGSYAAAQQQYPGWTEQDFYNAWKSGGETAESQDQIATAGDFIESGDAALAGIALMAGGAGLEAFGGGGALAGAEAGGFPAGSFDVASAGTSDISGGLLGGGSMPPAIAPATSAGYTATPWLGEGTGTLFSLSDPAAVAAAGTAGAGFAPTSLLNPTGSFSLPNTPPMPPASPESGPTNTAPETAPTGAGMFPEVTQFLKDNPWALPLAGTLLGGLTSGGSQSATQTTNAIPPELQQYFGNLFGGAAGLLPGGSTGSWGGTGGTGNLGLASNVLANTMSGAYQLPFQWNPYGGAQTQVGSNPYFGANNPYLQGALDKASGDVTSRVMSQFNRPGAYGGSANQEILARELGNMQNQFRYQDYGLQAQLGEADVNRRTNTSLADILRNSGLWNTDMSRNLQNYQTDMGRQFAAATSAPSWQTGVTESQFAPYSQYANLLKGWGGTTTQQYPQASTAQGALGGALSGYALSRMFG